MGEKYHFARRPYAHQVKAIRKLASNGYGGALLMQPRTGKTKVVVDWANIQHLKGRVNRVLVVCPAGVMGVWPDEIVNNTDSQANDINFSILVWDKRARKLAKERNRPDLDLPRYGRGTLDWVIVNYDAFATPGAIRGRDEDGALVRSRKRGGRYDILKKVKAWQPDLIVLDESHRIKSPSAKKSTAMHQFQRVPYRVICTGTVVTKSKRIFDVYSQWKFLNPNRFRSHLHPDRSITFGEFKSRFATFVTKTAPTGYTYDKWVGNQNEEELHRLIHLDAFSVLREDCYDLPRLTNQIIHVDLDESAGVYDQMARDLVARILTGEITEASIPLVQRLRLQQITSGITTTLPSPEHPEGRLVDIGAEKLRVLEDRLEDLFEAGEKIIIGALFKRDLARIETLVRGFKPKVPITVIKGGVKPSERAGMARAWEKLEGPAVFLGQPGAMAEGIDLRSAAITIWYSLPQSWVNFQQFSDRNALSESPRFAEFLLAPGVDELIYDTLQGDGEVGKAFITSPERLLRE